MNLMELVSNDNVHLAQESHTKETCHNSMLTIHISQVTHLGILEIRLKSSEASGSIGLLHSGVTHVCET
jgi:hypothetical protein